jgi:hypothetical protein
LSPYLLSKLLLLVLFTIICFAGYLAIKALPENNQLRVKLLLLKTPYALKVAKISVFVVIISYWLGALILYG